MSQAGVVTWLAVRELWITFRTLVVLVAFVGAGATVALLPAAPSVTLERLALGMAVATVATAALAAWSLAEERTSGRSGWLITRSVARGTYLAGWFVAFMGVALAGIGAAGFLGWMTVSSAVAAVEPIELAAALAGVAAAAGASVSLGLLAGLLARPPMAALIAALACLTVGAATIAVPGVAALVPQAMLGGVAQPGSDLSGLLRAAGTALAATALLLAAARVAMERTEL